MKKYREPPHPCGEEVQEPPHPCGEEVQEPPRPRGEEEISPFLDRISPIDMHGSVLPHWNQAGKYVFITFRLSDSIPRKLRDEISIEIKKWKETNPEPWNEKTKKKYRRRFSDKMEQWLDNGYGSCILKDYTASEIVSETFCYNNGKKYVINDGVIMPNHIHILLLILEGDTVEEILQEWKSVSSHKLRKIFGETWCGWMKHYYDRHIRNEEHLKTVNAYIKKNWEQGGIRRFNREEECWELPRPRGKKFFTARAR